MMFDKDSFVFKALTNTAHKVYYTLCTYTNSWLTYLLTDNLLLIQHCKDTNIANPNPNAPDSANW